MHCLKLLKSISLFLFLGLSLAACQSNKNEKVNLKINFQPGDKYQYTTNIEQDITTMGTVNIKMNFTIDMLYEMFPKEGDLQKLGVTYDRLVLQGSTPMGEMTYDSKNPDKSTSGINEMGNIVGKTIYVYLNTDGTLQKVEGLDQLKDPAMEKLHPGSPVTDSSFTMMMQNAFDVYPGKPVSVGAHWEKNTVMAISTFKFNMKSTYTLASVKDGIADITVVSELKLPEMEMEQNGFKMKMKMNGRQEGNMEVDVATGQIISGATTQNIEGQMNAGGQEMPMTIKSTIHTKSKKL